MTAPIIKQLDQAGADLIKGFEDIRLRIYNDSNGDPTIGAGHKLTAAEIASGIYKNGITLDQADALFEHDIVAFEATVAGLGLTDQNEFNACCSLAYNLGIGGFVGHDVYNYLKKGLYMAACKAFIEFDHSNTTELLGLLRRRITEMDVFLSGNYPR